MSSVLSTLGNVVPGGYSYSEKLVVPAEDLVLAGARLKWYDIHPASTPISAPQRAEASGFLAGRADADGLHLRDDLGFVILHRAGPMLLLLLTTWRNTNEMWESVFAKRADEPGGYQPVPQESAHKATYCVWELGPVWHERNAWVRFLSSTRDDAAKQAYLDDRFSGSV